MSAPDPNKRLGYYMELSQIGFEMAAPIGLGAFVDHWLGVGPWCAVVGAVLGLGGGLFHLVRMSNREPKEPDQES
jgi:F0F1-type ATP synthase assembly protein I